MKKQFIYAIAFALTLSLGFTSCSDDDDDVQKDNTEQTGGQTGDDQKQDDEIKLVSELKCTVSEFASKYQTLKKGQAVNVTLTDVSNSNIAKVSEILKKMNGTSLQKAATDSKYIIVLVLESTDNALTEIPAEAFKGCEVIQAITIPECVEKIEAGAFEGCINLEKAEIKGNAIITENAFDKVVEIVKSVIEEIIADQYDFFADNVIKLSELDQYLTNNPGRVKIKMTDINNGNWAELEKILMSHGENSEVYLNLSSSIGLTEIPKNALKDCRTLTRLYLTNTNHQLTIPEPELSFLTAFPYCLIIVDPAMKDKYSFHVATPDDLIATVKFDGQEIKGEAGEYFTAPELDIPHKDGFKSVWRYVDYNGNITSVCINPGDQMIYGNYKYVSGYWSEVDVNNLDEYLNSKSGEITVICSGLFDGANWVDFHSIIQKHPECIINLEIPETDYYTEVPDYLLRNLNDQEINNLKSIKLPNGITKLGSQYAFIETIEGIILPNTIEEIGQLCFHRWIGLKKMDIPESVTSIDWGAFSDCLSLTNITINNSNKVIQLSDDLFGEHRDADYFIKYCEIYNYTAAIDFVKNINIVDNPTIYVPAKFLDDYKGQYPQYAFEAIK